MRRPAVPGYPRRLEHPAALQQLGRERPRALPAEARGNRIPRRHGRRQLSGRRLRHQAGRRSDRKSAAGRRPSRHGDREPRHLGDKTGAILLPYPQRRPGSCTPTPSSWSSSRATTSCAIACRGPNIPPPIAERPMPSWLGAVVPRLTWLVVNRLGLSEFGRARRERRRCGARDHEAAARGARRCDGPVREDLLLSGEGRTGHARNPVARRRSVLGCLRAPRPRPGIPAGLVDGQHGRLGDRHLAARRSRRKSSTARCGRRKSISTASWLIGARDLARERGVKFMVALAPVPVVDPTYAEFWSPMAALPQAIRCSAKSWHRALRKELEAKGVTTVDLQDDLKGVRGHLSHLRRPLDGARHRHCRQTDRGGAS